MQKRHHQECFNKKYHSLRCRVWDYPIKEQYTSIYKVLVINNNKEHFQIQPEGKLGIMLLCNDGFDHHRGPGDQQDRHGGHLWGGLPKSPGQHRCNCHSSNFSIFICPTGHSDHEKNEKDLQTVLEDRHTAIIFLSFSSLQPDQEQMENHLTRQQNNCRAILRSSTTRARSSTSSITTATSQRWDSSKLKSPKKWATKKSKKRNS